MTRTFAPLESELRARLRLRMFEGHSKFLIGLRGLTYGSRAEEALL